MAGEGRAHGRAETWPPWIAAWPRPALRRPYGFLDLPRRAAQRLHEWIMVEVGPGRLVPWIAVSFGTGIVIYFAIDREPEPWAAALVLALGVAAAILLRRRPIAFPLALGLATLA